MQTAGIVNKKKDDFALNVLKGLAMFLVVFYHFQKYWFHNNFSECGGRIFYYLLSFTSLGVPIFFFINGALLLNKESMDWKKWTMKMAGMIGMTLIWSVLIEFFQFWYNGYDEWESFLLYIYTGKYLNYLWFIKSLIVIYMLFPIVWLAYSNSINEKKYGMFISVFFISLSAFGNNLLLMIANVIKYFINGGLLSSNGTYGFFDKFLSDYRGGGICFLLPILL